MGTRDRRPYLSATVLNQALLDQMADNGDFGIEMAATIETPTTTLYVSDRNKYVGGIFYENRCQFPVIKRTIGEWLSPTIEFSTLELPLSDVDGAFNNYLPGGSDFGGWIGKTVEVSVGIRDAGATFFSIYRGQVTEIGGLSRDRSKIIIRTRDDLDRLNQNFPKTALTSTSFGDIEEGMAGTILPVIYGDFTVAPMQTDGSTNTASVPAYVVNGANAGVLAGSTNLRLIISENDNKTFDQTNVWVKRGDQWDKIPSGNITSVTGNRDFRIVQGFTSFDSAPYLYQGGDLFFVRVTGVDLGAYTSNLVWQARHILLTQAGAVSGDFASNWTTYRDKASPSESSISGTASRVWLQDPESAVTYVLSMLEQVRLEMFIDRDLKLKLSSLHLDDFVPAPTYVVRQWDIQDNTLVPQLDDRNMWNRVRAQYAYDPSLKALSRQTAIFKNQDAIDQAEKAISKQVEFPNLYVEADVVKNVREMLRLASGYPEHINITLSPRSLLLDIGDFVTIRVARETMGAVVFDDVPALVREVGFDPNGLKMPVKLWSLQMTPFPGWNPGYSGIVGGSTATITQE